MPIKLPLKNIEIDGPTQPREMVTVPVTERALVQRINRKLAKTWAGWRKTL